MGMSIHCAFSALALHHGFLQAEAFGEEYNPEEDFNDRSAPRFRAIHKVGIRLIIHEFTGVVPILTC
jgi:hypothetical protein